MDERRLFNSSPNSHEIGDLKDPDQENAEPTPLDQLIPGIDLTRLSTKEKIAAIEEERQRGVATKIGRAQGDTQYLSDFLINSGPEKVKTLEERFRGQFIVEIGPGENTTGYQLANLLGARAYIAVDPFYADYVRINIAQRSNNTGWMVKDRVDPAQEKPRNALDYLNWGIPMAAIEDGRLIKNRVRWNVVEDDALALLSALPAGSVSIIMSGIRDGVIPRDRLQGIAREIDRVLDPKGALLAIDSAIRLSPHLKAEAVSGGPRSRGGTFYTRNEIADSSSI